MVPQAWTRWTPWFFGLIVALVCPCAAQVAAPEHPEQAETRVKRVVREVLAEREFVQLRREQKLTWTQRVRQWIVRAVQWVDDAFESMPRWLWWTILIWMVLALLAIAAHLTYSLVMAISRPSARRLAAAQEGSFSERWLGERDLDYDELNERARRLVAERQFTAAVRYLFVAGLMLLQRGGWIQFHRSKTDGDYLHELRPYPRIRQAMEELTRIFERTAYGDHGASRDQVQTMAAIVEGLAHEGHRPERH